VTVTTAKVVLVKASEPVTSRSRASFFMVSRPAHGETGTGTDERGTSDE